MSPVARAWPQRLRSQRLGLVAMTSLRSRPDWLDEAERAVLGAEPGCPLERRLEQGDQAYWLRLTTPDGPRTIGALAAREADGALLWTWLAVAASWRAFGYGGAAVPLLERAAARAGLSAARVRVPASNGVALYFWLRLGYRPLRGSEAGGQAGSTIQTDGEAGTWMARDSITAATKGAR